MGPKQNDTQQRQHQRVVSSVKILDSWISPFHLYCPFLLEISLSPSSSLPLHLSLSLHQSWYKTFHVRSCIALAFRTNQGLYCNPTFCNTENHPSGLSHRKSSCPTPDGLYCCLKHQRKDPEASFLLHPSLIYKQYQINDTGKYPLGIDLDPLKYIHHSSLFSCFLGGENNLDCCSQVGDRLKTPLSRSSTDQTSTLGHSSPTSTAFLLGQALALMLSFLILFLFHSVFFHIPDPLDLFPVDLNKYYWWYPDRSLNIVWPKNFFFQRN